MKLATKVFLIIALPLLSFEQLDRIIFVHKSWMNAARKFVVNQIVAFICQQ